MTNGFPVTSDNASKAQNLPAAFAERAVDRQKRSRHIRILRAMPFIAADIVATDSPGGKDKNVQKRFNAAGCR